jgi:peptidoglycan/LPS O-acetylase OafA/YrhL
MPEIDHLRAYAALLILLYHGLQLIGAPLVHGRAFDSSIPWPQPVNPLTLLIVEGHTAVSLFIVLSGFILSVGILDKTLDYGRFVLARVLRIYPMLLLCLMLAVATTGADLLAFLNSALPIDPRTAIASPFTAMFWAVKVELQCYLLFPALLWLLWRHGPQALLGVIGLALVFRLVAVLGAGANTRDLSYWTLAGRIDQFVIGMLAASFYKRWIPERLSTLWFPVALGVAVVMLFVFNRLGGWPNESLWRVVFSPIEGAVWALVIVSYLPVGRLLSGRRIGATLTGLGTISYSAYLLHPVVISAVVRHHWSLELTGRGDWDALLTTLLIVFPVVTLLAALTYRMIEAPFMAMRPRYAQPRVSGDVADMPALRPLCQNSEP